MHANTRTGAAAVGVAVLAMLIGGCTEVEKVLNQGADTSCRDYVNQEPATKRITIAKAVEQRSGKQPSENVIDSKIVEVDLLCATQRNVDTPIKNADIAGIFLNK
ncbi:hypothetical protein [Nocardia sp. NPDC058666]|uniref:hypothetical protein n=1 Tax=unclassified Nocardia TaxID=2637762 RepID=UPI003649F8EF